jgi:AraC-like DNA-binding protein
VHDELTIACVDRGAARFALESRHHVASAGSVFVIPPQAVHTGEPAILTGYSYRVLYLDPSWLAAHAGRARLGYHWRAADAVLHHHALARALDHVHNLIAAPAAALEQGEALAAVVQILDDAIRSSGATGATSAACEPAAVRRARDFLHARWRDDFSLADLASAVGLSPFYLVRSFRAHVGVPPFAYRRALRVDAARKLLQAGEPPARVALLCGFYDHAHLARHFKLATGVPPSRYARRPAAALCSKVAR